MRTYYCENCKEMVDIDIKVSFDCSNKCGKTFGYNFNPSKYINMRKTWSGQTKVEFSQTTIDQDIAERNKR
tara:strand:+ start:703 stop:915 length:213 start_codon:yes stop_codon:yes gene_type:complete